MSTTLTSEGIQANSLHHTPSTQAHSSGTQACAARGTQSESPKCAHRAGTHGAPGDACTHMVHVVPRLLAIHRPGNAARPFWLQTFKVLLNPCGCSLLDSLLCKVHFPTAKIDFTTPSPQLFPGPPGTKRGFNRGKTFRSKIRPASQNRHQGPKASAACQCDRRLCLPYSRACRRPRLSPPSP